MKPKDYLQQIYITEKKIRRLQAYREQVRADLYSVRSPADMNVDRVQTSLSGDTMLKLIAKVDRIERRLEKEVKNLTFKRDRIVRQIERMPDITEQEILYKRHVECKPWHTIALEMSISERHIYRLYGKALNSFGSLYLRW